MRLFCFVWAKTVYSYGCMYFLAELMLVCVDVMSSAYAMTWTGALSGGMSAVYMFNSVGEIACGTSVLN